MSDDSGANDSQEIIEQGGDILEAPDFSGEPVEATDTSLYELEASVETPSDSAEPVETPDIAVPTMPETTTKDEPNEPVNSPSDDPTFRVRPGGFEVVPTPETEDIISPHIPEVPYGGMYGPERGG